MSFHLFNLFVLGSIKRYFVMSFYFIQPFLFCFQKSADLWCRSIHFFSFVFDKALFCDGVLHRLNLFVLFSIKRCFVVPLYVIQTF